MGGLHWKSNMLLSALLVPGWVWADAFHRGGIDVLSPLDHRVVFAVFFVLNLFLWGAGSSAAIPFTTLLALLCLWFGISLPLNFIGALIGFMKRVSNYGNTTAHHSSRLCYAHACSLKTPSSFYNTQTELDMEMKLTSIDFSCWGAEGFLETQGCKFSVTNLSIILHILGILTANFYLLCYFTLNYEWVSGECVRVVTKWLSAPINWASLPQSSPVIHNYVRFSKIMLLEWSCILSQLPLGHPNTFLHLSRPCGWMYIAAGSFVDGWCPVFVLEAQGNEDLC